MKTNKELPHIIITAFLAFALLVVVFVLQGQIDVLKRDSDWQMEYSEGNLELIREVVDYLVDE